MGDGVGRVFWGKKGGQMGYGIWLEMRMVGVALGTTCMRCWLSACDFPSFALLYSVASGFFFTTLLSKRLPYYEALEVDV